MTDSRARRLIVNADDLGRTVGINEGVFEAAERGIVTSATLMVNYAAAADAAQRCNAAGAPALGVGLHVAITGGPLALPSEAVPSLYDASGRVPAKPEDHGELAPDEVLAEIRAQLERFRELVGRDPTHFDSHHHAHRLPVVLDAVVAVARETGLPVRNAGGAMGDRLGDAGIATTRPLIERFFAAGATQPDLLAILVGIPAGWSELMCHPASVDDELRRASSYAEPRAAELAALTDPAVGAAIEEHALSLVDFGALAEHTTAS